MTSFLLQKQENRIYIFVSGTCTAPITLDLWFMGVLYGRKMNKFKFSILKKDNLKSSVLLIVHSGSPTPYKFMNSDKFV